MKKYRCYGIISASKYLGEVEANSTDEAIEKAYSLNTFYVSVCHQCAREVEIGDITDVEAEEIP